MVVMVRVVMVMVVKVMIDTIQVVMATKDMVCDALALDTVDSKGLHIKREVY